MVLYTAAHGLAGSENFPLGGGAAICRMLGEEWARSRPFEWRVLGPGLLASGGPGGADLVRFSEREYAGFSRELERVTTAEVMRHDPKTTVVLANDVSEGPDFRRLAAAGYAIATIYHVDVVAYIANIYFRGWLRPETTVRWYDRLAALPLPDMVKLVWKKQRDSVECSRKLIVPSRQMVDVMRRCYPATGLEKFAVMPWGAPPLAPVTTGAVESLRRDLAIPDGAQVILTLSRISPEKGQDTLIEALLEWERNPGFPAHPVYLIICGEAAFMKGREHLRKLHALASRLRHVKTIFPGHVVGSRKAEFLALADLYVFPSRHESYGLTLMEAFQSGLAAVCMDHHGAGELMRPEFGLLAANRTELWQAIARLLNDPQDRRNKAEAARQFARENTFTATAGRLAALLQSIAEPRP
ncbi:MAG: glycosyltransferase family 4 protein [Acidobacteria bacterium]|nr:glycosyltransferase family 4 protein [Acidobacteriota bacterium]